LRSAEKGAELEAEGEEKEPKEGGKELASPPLPLTFPATATSLVKPSIIS
jgi:hypothetical protein